MGPHGSPTGTHSLTLAPLAEVSAFTTRDHACNNTFPDGLLNWIARGVGGIVLRPSALEHPEAALQRLDLEMRKRLAFPWLVSRPLSRQRVFWVQGRQNIEGSRRAYEAAWALGIDIVVLDQPGHWLEDQSSPCAYLREAFISVGVDVDDGFIQRIIDAVRSYPRHVDGIVSISDARLPGVARACEILGLPTSPSAAYAITGDKGATRLLEEPNGRNQLVINGPDELGSVLEQSNTQFSYPLIVKPITGWNSDCVAKCSDETELRAAVLRASSRHANSPNRSTGVVIEPYIDGPEVDANFVLLNGEVLFCDITDDFPCTGDLAGGGPQPTANFMETLMDVPSALPEAEKDMMKDSLRQSILRQGFQSGVFHCEARVRHSRAYYDPRADNGILDLHVTEKNEKVAAEEPSCYLHEVNARPPGYINTVAAMFAYGVDYYAIRLLLSLGAQEDDRVRSLAQPFLGGEPQYTLGITVLQPTRAGIMASKDAVIEMIDKYPSMREFIVDYQTCKRKGDMVQGPDSGELWCVAYVTVASRTGREECLEMVQWVREHFTYKLEGE
ncbi:hypothetical protein DL766_000047 [Monosporascus sp. MC13-8B]|uniref:ATP-grasp domain-containing protein n=1 Tax=Monosporascus cannonballus TaxID=155416 RepID=A0ABY0HKS7_9PEZI|nr:hypothetical protein DL762_000416 [Monosporascus cannonballus]RYP01182.1 hypothetical protein DL763_000307 [Monosporascus cannonballus]RYP40246.1 hypothetical protein DL766_000047 [Monosporascus sp. MC13-8B]